MKTVDHDSGHILFSASRSRFLTQGESAPRPPGGCDQAARPVGRSPLFHAHAISGQVL